MEPALLPAEVGKALSYSIKHENETWSETSDETEIGLKGQGVTDSEGITKSRKPTQWFRRQVAALHMLRLSIGGGFFVILTSCVTPPAAELFATNLNFKTLMDQARQRHDQSRQAFSKAVKLNLNLWPGSGIKNLAQGEKPAHWSIWQAADRNCTINEIRFMPSAKTREKPLAEFWREIRIARSQAVA